MMSESMGHHDSEIMDDDGSIDRDDA
jgi:hypothetical protein